MRLSCPQCHTEYDVPDAALEGRARTLRCADCGTKWKAPALPAAELAVPEDTAPDQISIPEPEHDVPPVDAEFGDAEPAIAGSSTAEGITAPSHEPATLSATRDTAIPPRLSAAQPAPVQPSPNRGLGISILLVLLVIVIILAEHRAIGHAWPPSLRLFNALGLH